MTHTYANLEVSPAAYIEIRDKLLAAGYDHAINDRGEVDMHGLALISAPAEPVTPAGGDGVRRAVDIARGMEPWDGKTYNEELASVIADMRADPFNEWFVREFPEVERRHKDGDISATGNKFSAREGWNAALQSQQEAGAVVWAIYAKSDEYFKPVRIPHYFGTIAEISKQVLADAHREGYFGTFGERMAELGWWLEPLFLGQQSRRLGVDVAKDGTETAAYGRVVDGVLLIDRIEQTPALDPLAIDRQELDALTPTQAALRAGYIYEPRCRCGCHRGENVKHFVPCCSPALGDGNG